MIFMAWIYPVFYRSYCIVPTIPYRMLATSALFTKSNDVKLSHPDMNILAKRGKMRWASDFVPKPRCVVITHVGLCRKIIIAYGFFVSIIWGVPNIHIFQYPPMDVSYDYWNNSAHIGLKKPRCVGFGRPFVR